MADGFRLELDSRAIEALADSEEAEDLVEEVGEMYADAAAELAPKDTGAGAESIHAEVDQDDDGYYADVSWDADHFYMGFKEQGTEHEPAQPFLVPAADHVNL